MPKATSREITERYLRDLWSAMGLGTKETSGYPALTNLLNEVGSDLKPKVRAINHPGQQKVGIPDFGLFTQQQLRNVDDDGLRDLLAGPAERGLLEVKGFDDDVVKIAGTDQVAKYLDRAGLVLVTNYWDFLVVSRGLDGALVLGDRFSLTPTGKVFRGALADPGSLAAEQGDGLIDFLRRTLLRKATLADPRDVADLLANYARDARRRIERKGNPAGLVALRRSLEQALGISFEGERGNAFFRSTLVQTLFYGLFSAWVIWNDHGRPGGRFDWRTAVYEMRVPVIQSLFAQIAQPQRLQSLNLTELLDWTGDTLNRVQHETFFERFEREHAVRYFYEPFLEYFDPELRRDLGVWYTPPEVVRYMVARVDHALRTELGVADGLADERVHVLDPATGTGSFPVEVLNVIAATLERNGVGATRALQVKRAAMERIHAFELLPAPYVIAHMQVALLLDGLGASLGDRTDGTPERASIFLTNSLTGWRQGDRFIQDSFLPELSREREEAYRIKQDEKIWVVLGNPPYSALAGVQPIDEGESVEVYKQGLSAPRDKGGWGIGKYNLDDLYVRFLRLAEHRIVDQTGHGIVCFISNYSYLSDPSFVVLRERFRNEFDGIWIDSLNGDSRETGKRTPDGASDPSVFSTQYNRAGIRLGTAIGLFVRQESRSHGATVHYRDFWGVGKANALLASLEESSDTPPYVDVVPSRDRRFDFRPAQIAPHYVDWSIPPDWAAEPPISGLQERRRGDLMDHDPDRLRARMQRYFSSSETLTSLKSDFPGLTGLSGNFEPRAARTRLLESNALVTAVVVRYALFPFDNRWAFLSTAAPLWHRPRPDLLRHTMPDNRYLILRFRQANQREGIAMTMSSVLPDDHLLAPNIVSIPIRLNQSPPQPMASPNTTGPTSRMSGSTQANLSLRARSYLQQLGFQNPDESTDASSLLWMHALGVGYSPAYNTENADGVAEDWPRIPLPNDPDLLRTSADLGRLLAALLDPEQSVPGVTTQVRPELRGLGQLTTIDSSQITGSDDLALTVGWGSGGSGRPVMPGRGRTVPRPYTSVERERLARWGDPLGTGESAVFALLGEATRDVFLNDRVCWSNVPDRVWNYNIGGYQVIKKWLSYREQRVLGRDLTLDEARYVEQMVRRIAAILLLGPQLDASYQAIAADPYPWPRPPAASGQQRLTW